MESLAYEYGLKGLKTAYVSKSMTDPEIKKGVREGKYQLVFFTPEAILNPSWRTVLITQPYQEHLVAFVVDEAHKVYKWYV